MKFEDIEIGRLFYFDGLLHEKVGASTARQISSTKKLSPFRLDPDATVEKA